MQRKCVKSLVAAALLGAASLVPASPAAAHESSYCGHGVDGIVWVVEYGGSSNVGPYVHQHLYYHIHWVLPRHTDWKTCPVH
jgi:hypothetical protein